MSSKSAHRRRVQRNRRQGRNQARPQPVDPHLQVISASLTSIYETMAELAAVDDPLAAARTRLSKLVADLAVRFRAGEPARIIEVARLRCLPWSFLPPAGAEG